MAAERQSVEARPRIRQRGSTMRASTIAPEITLTVVKLAASISSWPNARRQRRELAAKASIAMSVSNNVLAATELEFLEGTLVTAN